MARGLRATPDTGARQTGGTDDAAGAYNEAVKRDPQGKVGAEAAQRLRAMGYTVNQSG